MARHLWIIAAYMLCSLLGASYAEESKKPDAPKQAEGQPPAKREWKAGDRVLAVFRDPRGLFPGTVKAVEGERVQVQFDDGDTGWTTSDGVVELAIKVGDRVFARFRDGRFYPGRVAGTAENAYDIQYDDGDKARVPVAALVVPRSGVLTGFGTGFFVTSKGHVVTACHVVFNRKTIKVRTASGDLAASVVCLNRFNDVAVLKVEGTFTALPLISSGRARLGASVFTIGFPQVQHLGRNPKLAKGEISCLTGLQDDPVYFQTNVPVAHGNSGGALVDDMGNVIGVITAGLGTVEMIRLWGEVPPLVNYALKSSFVLATIESMPDVVAALTPPRSEKGRAFEDLVKDAEAATVMVVAE